MTIFVGPGRLVGSSPRRKSAHPGGINEVDVDEDLELLVELLLLSLFFAAPDEGDRACEVRMRFRREELIVTKAAMAKYKKQTLVVAKTTPRDKGSLFPVGLVLVNSFDDDKRPFVLSKVLSVPRGFRPLVTLSWLLALYYG
jgi:hypothetical protein